MTLDIALAPHLAPSCNPQICKPPSRKPTKRCDYAGIPSELSGKSKKPANIQEYKRRLRQKDIIEHRKMRIRRNFSIPPTFRIKKLYIRIYFTVEASSQSRSGNRNRITG